MQVLDSTIEKVIFSREGTLKFLNTSCRTPIKENSLTENGGKRQSWNQKGPHDLKNLFVLFLFPILSYRFLWRRIKSFYFKGKHETRATTSQVLRREACFSPASHVRRDLRRVNRCERVLEEAILFRHPVTISHYLQITSWVLYNNAGAEDSNHSLSKCSEGKNSL